MNQNRTAEKNSQTLSSLIEKNPCSLCRKARMPICKCGAGGGSGGASGGNENNESGKSAYEENNASSNLSVNTIDSTISIASLSEQTGTILLTDVIAGLILNKILFIDDNKDIGIQTIRCNPTLMTAEQKVCVKQFMMEIQNEFEEFKKQNKDVVSEQDLAVKLDKQGNITSLTIKLSTPELYHQFTQQLHNKNLLSLSYTGQQEKENYQESHSSEKTRKSPFSIIPRPKGYV